MTDGKFPHKPQLILDIGSHFKITREDFIVGSFNSKVVKFLFNDFKSGNNQVVIIYGNKAVGKSYITRLYLQENRGILVDINRINDLNYIESITKANNNMLLLEDIQILTRTTEQGLFNLYNAIIGTGNKLILSSKLLPGNLSLQLADLQSRLQKAIALEITEPCDNDLRLMLFKMLQDQQLSVELNIVDYALKRIERTAASLYDFANKIGNIVAITKKKISITLVQQVLNDQKWAE